MWKHGHKDDKFPSDSDYELIQTDTWCEMSIRTNSSQKTRSWDSHHFILGLTIAICNNSIDYRVLQWRSQCFLSASSFFWSGNLIVFCFSLSQTWYTTCTSFTCYSRTPVKHRIVFTHTLLILVIRLRTVQLCTKSHSSGLQEEKEHRIYIQLYIWFKNTNESKEKGEYETDGAFLLSHQSNLAEERNKVRNCTGSCDTLSLLPMPSEWESGSDARLQTPLYI